MPERKGPTKGMMKRLVEVAPEKMMGELDALQRDRDALKQALATKIMDYVKTLSLTKDDVLILKPPPTNPMVTVESLTEVAVAVTERLKARTGWQGVMLVEAGAMLVRLPLEEEKIFYEALKKKHGGN